MISIGDIQSLLIGTNPRGSKAYNLPRMIEHQSWVRFHVDTNMRRKETVPDAHFRDMVRSIITPKSYDMFCALMRYPLPTNVLTSVIFDRLSRLFEGRDKSFSYQFTDRGDGVDWEDYRQNVLDEPNVWKTKAWEYFKTEPNCVVVVDMAIRASEGDTKLRPYFYFVTVDRIIDYASDDAGNILWIVYTDGERKFVYAIDQECYRRFALRDGNVVREEYSENYHWLGKCPAAFLGDEPISISNCDIKASPITRVLSELDWYLFADISKRHLDTYGSYPIYSGYEAECDYETKTSGGDVIHCVHGKMEDDNGNIILLNDGHPMPCPRCSSHRIAGAGQYVEVPAPVDGTPDMRNPVQILEVDKNSLDYNKENIDALKKYIISVCVGKDENAIDDFSQSESQISAGYERQSTIMQRIKKTFENAQWFVDDTICRLRYGDSYVSCDINYGNDFYTMTTSQLRDRYKKAKDSGATESDLISLRKQITETEYRNSGADFLRVKILEDIEPLLGKSVQEAIQAAQYVNQDDLKIKVNFQDYVRRFEVENGSVVDFGTNIPYEAKIKQIKKRFVEYSKETNI